MCQKKKSSKPNWFKNKLQNFLAKYINKISLAGNVQPNIKTNWEELPAETT